MKKSLACRHIMASLLRLTLGTFLLVFAASSVSFGDPAVSAEISKPPSDSASPMADAEADDTAPLTVTKGQIQSHDRKNILLEESRGLSGFFKFGLAINLIMAVSFAWWFWREWRKPRK